METAATISAIIVSVSPTPHSETIKTASEMPAIAALMIRSRMRTVMGSVDL